MRYIPRSHSGNDREIARGLIEEMKDIAKDGWMRMHAKGREMERIQKALNGLGYTVLRGCEEDEGFILILDGHQPECWLSGDEGTTCRCKATIVERFPSPF